MGKINSLLYYLKFVFFLGISACSNKKEMENEVDKIMDLHKLQKKYHFEKMSKEFVEQFSRDHISINKGTISKLSKTELEKRFQKYFNSVNFIKWDDKTPPIIRFSQDRSMAYSVVNKEVIIEYLNEENHSARDTTQFAWLAIYTKEKGNWKLDCIASTEK